MTRGQTLRLIWIDAFVEHGEFALQGAHLCLVFDLSVPQASHDISRFRALFPDRLRYDASLNGYFAIAGSEPAFETSDHSAVFLACAAVAKAADLLTSRGAA